MLLVNRLMCLLSFIFLFSSYNIGTLAPFHTLAIYATKNNSIEIIHKDKFVTAEETFDSQIQNSNQIEIEKESELKKQNELEIAEQLQKKKSEEKKKNKPEYKEFILTFYTSLESENSSAGAVTCQNKPLTPGGVANNVIPQNTKIYLEGYGQVTVNDRGSDKYFGVDNRLDVYIPREPGESNRQYSRRVNNYGIQKVQGYIIK
ncbi:3D domain-containing protein [Clostridium sp. C2-6-12]|uniref:3D domain-containing protein n=1 Tax=Clostridium sp. C2-6-12 TaxID=2698832 RepID=UPI00136C7934|nr:3D domain-containing protein [Clostridium sp. C2-6-12]